MTDDVDVHELARELTAAIAALEVSIAARAHELAQPRIEAAEAIHAGRSAAIEQAWAADRSRNEALIAELRRQYDAADRIRGCYIADNRRLRARLQEVEAREAAR